MKKWSTNQLTVLNALASFLFNSMLGKLRATMGYYSLNTPVRLSQTSTWCYLWSSFTSLLVFTWWILYLNLSIFLPWELDSSALHGAGVNAEALPPAVLLEYSVRLTRASFLPSAWVSSVVSDSATPWTVARQLPLYVGFSRQEY